MDGEYYTIILNIDNDLENIIEQVEYLDNNLSNKINILKLSDSLYAAYTTLSKNKNNLSPLLSGFSKIFYGARIQQIDYEEYKNYTIISQEKIRKLIKDRKENKLTIYFPLGSEKIDKISEYKLNNFVKKLDTKGNKIYIDGHTDNIRIGSSKYKNNMELSKYRANNVQHKIEELYINRKDRP